MLPPEAGNKLHTETMGPAHPSTGWTATRAPSRESVRSRRGTKTPAVTNNQPHASTGIKQVEGGGTRRPPNPIRVNVNVRRGGAGRRQHSPQRERTPSTSGARGLVPRGNDGHAPVPRPLRGGTIIRLGHGKLQQTAGIGRRAQHSGRITLEQPYPPPVESGNHCLPVPANWHALPRPPPTP